MEWWVVLLWIVLGGGTYAVYRLVDYLRGAP